MEILLAEQVLLHNKFDTSLWIMAEWTDPLQRCVWRPVSTVYLSFQADSTSSFWLTSVTSGGLRFCPGTHSQSVSL